MDISAQSILTVGGQSGPLQSIVAGLKPGESLTAQVLARTPGGMALVALAGKQIHFPLPPSLAAGTLLTLTVQQGSDGLQFVVQAQGSGAQAAAPRSAAPPLSPVPAGSSAPQVPTPVGASTTAGAPAAPTPQAPQAAPRPALFASSAPHLQPPLVNTRTGLPIPAPQGAVVGQTFAARVLSTPIPSTAIVSLGGQELPVSLPVPATPGTVLPLVVQAGPSGLQLAHAPAASGSLFSSPAPMPEAVLNQVPGAAPPLASGGATAPALPSVPQAAGTPAAASPLPMPTPNPAAPTSLASAQAAVAADAAATQPAQAALLATGPPSVLTQATLASLGNQNSLGALLSSVLRLGDRLKSLPDDVQRAIQRLGAAVLPLDDGAPGIADLQRAVARSGVFLESQLASGVADGAVDGDLKSLLITLRRVLGDWLGADVKPAVLSGKAPPPPQHGQAPRAPGAAPTAPLSDDASIDDIGKTLLSQTDAALSRLRLHQIASLPDRPDAATAVRHDTHLELPVTIGQQPGVLSLVISRDAEGDTPDRPQRNWRVQFAVNASVIGEVGAEVGLLAGRTNVVLSAAQPQSVEALGDHLDELSVALEAVGLTPGILRVRRSGVTPATPFSPPPASGRFLDRDT